jgi:hypothetical protein
MPGTEIIFEALLVMSDRPDASQSDLRSLSFEVMCDFIYSASDAILPHIMNQLMPNLLHRLFTTLSSQQVSQNDASLRSVTIAKLVSCLGSIFLRFSLTAPASAALSSCLKGLLDNQLSCSDNIVTFFLEALPADAALAGGCMCAEEVVLALAQLSKIVGAEFEKYLPVLHPKLITFMQSIHCGDLAYITCTSIGDIVRSIGPSISRFSEQLVQWIFYAGQLIAHPEVDTNYGVTTWNSVKCIAVSLVGDILMEVGASMTDPIREHAIAALSHAHNEIQKLLGRLATLSDDEADYTKSLIDDTLCLWMSACQAHKLCQEAHPGAAQVFASYVPPVLACITFADTFTKWLAEGDPSSSDAASMLCGCANLLTDVVKCLGPSVAVNLRSTVVVSEVLNVSELLFVFTI